MLLVRYVLRRPYTVVAMLTLICLLSAGAVTRMPIDIFPEINIPVVSVVWTYAGMSPQDIQNRILTLHERQLASLVDDISRIEAISYEGVGVEKVYLHEGADVSWAVSQLASSALVVLKYMPPNITPLYRMTQDDPMRVFVDAPQSVSADLMKVGVPARITLDDATQSAIEGKITRTAGGDQPELAHVAGRSGYPQFKPRTRARPLCSGPF